MKEDLYEILQVSPNADPEVIEAAYRRLARKFHPDHNPRSVAALEHMKRLNAAYAVLKIPVERARYSGLQRS